MGILSIRRNLSFALEPNKKELVTQVELVILHEEPNYVVVKKDFVLKSKVIETRIRTDEKGIQFIIESLKSLQNECNIHNDFAKGINDISTTI